MPTHAHVEGSAMKMGSRFRLWGPSPHVAPRRRQAPDWVDACVAEPSPAEGEDTPPRGCGWFDSSHELTAGLQVTEHLTPQAVVDAVPLGWWLDWQTAAAVDSPRQGGAH
jgi:hypothetical protein